MLDQVKNENNIQYNHYFHGVSIYVCEFVCLFVSLCMYVCLFVRLMFVNNQMTQYS
jgi:hypothetical protein